MNHQDVLFQVSMQMPIKNSMRVLSFGEIIFDLIGERECLGGAPLNVALHLARLGAESYLMSSVGPDRLGKKALERLDMEGVRTEFINLSIRETGIAKVKLKDKKADYEFNYPASWDEIRVNEKELDTLRALSFDAFVFGSLAQRNDVTRKTLISVLESGSFRTVFFDVNLRKHFYSEKILDESIKRSTILKFSEDESASLSFTLMVKNSGKAYLEKYPNLDIVIVTKGKDGADVFTRDKTVSVGVTDFPPCDTVGAGDSFSAAFLYTYLKTGDVKLSAEAASFLSSFVVSTEGATSPYSEEVIRFFSK